jgi:uncharacterized protein YqiB (DUF1249 family)
MKYLGLFTLIFICNLSTQAQFTTNVYWTEDSGIPNSNIIYYHPDKKLQWNDFLGNPVLTGNVAAITMSGFGYKASIKNNRKKGELSVAVYCYFSKYKSWVKPTKKSVYILNHEQHHFDVSFIAATMFATKLKNADINNKNYNDILPKLYQECCDLMNKMQDDYDGQTKNGQLKDVQEQWNTFFNKRLSAIIN